MTLDTAPDMLNVSEIKQITRLGKNGVQALFRNGVFPNLGTQKRFLTSKAALKRWLEQGGK
jgi:hypothetical protein